MSVFSALSRVSANLAVQTQSAMQDSKLSSAAIKIELDGSVEPPVGCLSCRHVMALLGSLVIYIDF